MILRDLIQLVEHRLCAGRQIDAVGSTVARILTPLEVPLLAQPIDQPTYGDLAHLQCLGNHTLRSTWIACNRSNEGPLRACETNALDVLIETQSCLARDNRQ